MSQRCRHKQEIKTCDVTYINFVVCSLGLASQEVDVFVKSTNEMLRNLYGYDEMTRPHLSIQAQVQNQQDVISLGLVQIARVRC
jgi:hypothetical protein